MTENFDALSFLMELVDAAETCIAQNNLIAAGVVTDPSLIRTNAEASSELLGVLVQSIQTTMSDAPEVKEALKNAVALIDI